jgi:hypothetical protein
VLEEGKSVWGVMLNQTDVMNNNNKFYVIQLIEADAGGRFWVWNRWGRGLYYSLFWLLNNFKWDRVAKAQRLNTSRLRRPRKPS